MMIDSKDLIKQFFDTTASSYEKVVNWTTFRKDTYWKKEIIKNIQRCDSILDLACGTGILTFKIAEKFPKTSITGVDITESYLNEARKKLKPNHKISFLHYDAEKLNLNLKFDCITSSYIPKYCSAEILISKCLTHLNPNGVIVLHDFTFPQNWIVKRLWNSYFYLLKIIGYFIPNWKGVFIDLPEFIKSSKWLTEYENVMKRSGFQVKIQHLTLCTSAILTGTKEV